MARLTLLAVAGLLWVHSAASALAQNVTTQQYDATRAGVQNQETLLTPKNVDSADFGKLFSLPVAGHVYAQPLYMAGLTMADGTSHNVIFVATEQDYVYAFDADGKNPARGYLWRDSLAGGAETWVSHADVNTGDIYPDIGITGTPVIDSATNTLYVVAKSKSTGAGPTSYFQRLHALSLVDGTEKLNGPTLIQAKVAGSGDGNASVTFNPLLENQRPGLVLAPTPNGTSAASVFITWASHGDNGSYHGWIIGYNAADISQQSGAWCDTPNGSQGGIWMAGGALSTDGQGDIFAAAGNGTFDADAGGLDYGDSVFSLALTGSALRSTTFFTPTKQSKLNIADNDMGVSSVVLLPTQPGRIPHLAVTSDKTGEIYLVNRDAMGGYSSSANASLQSFSIGPYSIRTSAAFFNNTLYVGGEGAPLAGWAFDPQTEQFATSPFTSTLATFGCSDCGGGGTTPSISANGTADAILWTLDNSGREKSPAILRAYDPANLQNELYDSSQAANNRDAAAIAVKFTTPVVANGHVYVGGINAVTVYGELHPAPVVTITANPTAVALGSQATLTVSASNASAVTVTGSDGSSYSLAGAGGTVTVTPTTATTYTASATGASGQGSASTTLSIAPVVISASAANIAAGQSSTLNVAASNATQVVVTGSDQSSYTLPPAGGSIVVTPTATTTYTATATTADGNFAAVVTVAIVPAPNLTLSVSKPSITAGSSAVLMLTASNATAAAIAGSDGSNYTLAPGGGTQAVAPAATVTYTASVSGIGGSATGSVTLAVTAAAPVVRVTASPAAIVAGGSSALSIAATNSTQVSVTGSDGSTYSLLGSGGTQVVAPTTTTTYTVTAIGAGGSSSASATVTVSALNTGVCLPSSPGVMICQPAQGSTSGSPVSITAGAKASSGYIAAIRAYVDNLAVFTEQNTAGTATFATTQAVTLAAGTHNLVIVAYQNSGNALVSSETLTVGSGGTPLPSPPPTPPPPPPPGQSCYPATAGVTICAPGQNATVASPVQILTGATAASGYLTAIRVYVDNVAQGTLANPQTTKSFTISQAFPLSPGIHSLAVVGYESTGGAVRAIETVNVGGAPNGGGCSSAGAGLVICSPAAGATFNSPAQISASATAAAGFITAMRIYVDGVAQTLLNNPQQSASFTINQGVMIAKGTHTLAVVGYQSDGGAVRAVEAVNVSGP